MKLNTELSHEAEYLGDVQENRVGIDKSNLDFIATLLTSNLYSKPLESFFRETVSNAYDSHIEAGTEEPILFLIEDTEEFNTYRISIRDYGVGLSSERFDKIYKNIGSSTKRESNDYIGMFGIGRFSCLSCADVANITSYYKGVKYSYLMYKNGGGINIDKISETEGDYKDGLEVSIRKYISNNKEELRKAISSLCLFDKLFITYKGENYFIKNLVYEFNNRKVINFDTFSYCTILSPYTIYFKVGKVLYASNSDKVDMCTSSGIIIDLPIGSVDITPNREALQYTDYTNKEISLRVAKVKDELQKITNSKIQKNITLSELCERFIYSSSYKVKIADLVYISVNTSDIVLEWDKVIIDGEHLPKDYNAFVSYIRWFGVDNSIIYKTISLERGRGRVCADKDMRNILTNKLVLATKEDNITRQVTLRYFQDNLKNTTVILTYGGLSELKDSIRKYCAKAEWIDDAAVEECIRFTFNHLPMASLSNNKVPAEYIKDFQEEQNGKRKKTDSRKIPIRIYRGFGYSVNSLDALDYNKEGFVLYTSHTKDDKILKELASLLSCYEGFNRLITIKSEYLHLLENNRRFIEVDKFIFFKNNVLSKLITCHIIYKKLERLPILPIVSEFKKKYKKQLIALRYYGEGDYFTNLVDYYKEKKWLNYFDIKYFSLAPYEIKALNEWQNLDGIKHNIIQMLAYNKYGRLQKIGLIPIKAPKITYNYENIQKTKLPSD